MGVLVPFVVLTSPEPTEVHVNPDFVITASAGPKLATTTLLIAEGVDLVVEGHLSDAVRRLNGGI